MKPINFYTNPDELDYEKDVDPVGRDLIKQINQTDYLRTTMYCSGHFNDEQEYPWMHAQMNLCLVAVDNTKAYIKLQECKDALWKAFGMSNVRGGNLYLYLDKDDDNKPYHISELLVEYGTKERRDKLINILTEILA